MGDPGVRLRLGDVFLFLDRFGVVFDSEVVGSHVKSRWSFPLGTRVISPYFLLGCCSDFKHASNRLWLAFCGRLSWLVGMDGSVEEPEDDLLCTWSHLFCLGLMKWDKQAQHLAGPVLNL